MAINKDTAKALFQTDQEGIQAVLPTVKGEVHVDTTHEVKELLASLQVAVRALQESRGQQPQVVVNMAELQPSTKRKTSLATLVCAVALVGAAGMVGWRVVEKKQERDAVTEATVPAALPVTDSTLPYLQNAGAETPIVTSTLFKSQVSIAEPVRVGGYNPDGTLNASLLRFEEGSTLYTLSLESTDTVAATNACSSLHAAVYKVTAQNSFGSLGPQDVKTSFAAMELAEQVRLATGLYDVTNQSDLEAALSTSYVLFITSTNEEIALLNGCGKV